MTEEIAILGAGSWGTALAIRLASTGRKVKLWAYESELVEIIREKRENHLYLPGCEIPPNVSPTGSLEEAASGRRVILNVLPSHAVRSVMSQASQYLKGHEIVVSATKGIENDTLMTVGELIKNITPSALHPRLTFISGPTFAREVAEGKPAAAAVASADPGTAREIQELMSTPCFRLYTNPDVTGVVLAGSYKNVIAIAAGISDGLGLGDNARATLITRGLAEMTRLGVKMGADSATFFGLAGVGDLVLTCCGGLSRNRSVGYKIGQGEKIGEILKNMNMVAEGVKTAKSIKGLMDRHGVDLPIAGKTFSILYENQDPMRAVTELMTRSLKGEIEP